MLGNLQWTALLLKRESGRVLEGELEHTLESVDLSPKVGSALEASFN